MDDLATKDCHENLDTGLERIPVVTGRPSGIAAGTVSVLRREIFWRWPGPYPALRICSLHKPRKTQFQQLCAHVVPYRNENRRHQRKPFGCDHALLRRRLNAGRPAWAGQLISSCLLSL